jgi:hypothetical protein
MLSTIYSFNSQRTLALCIDVEWDLLASAHEIIIGEK